MDLIEGVSNEVLFAFTVTVLLGLITIFLTFFNERSHGQNEVIPDIIDGTQSEPSINADLSSSNVNDNVDERKNNEDQTVVRDGHDVQVGTENGASFTSSGGNVRRRSGNNSNLEQEQSEQSQEEIMLVRVKHNENIRSFNVSKNLTVLELKRLAFSNELDAGKRVRFVFGGQLLRNDNDPLTTYGVQDNTVVHCVITDPPQQSALNAEENEEDLDLTRLLIPLLTAGDRKSVV